MATIAIALTARPAWKTLEAHYKRICSLHLRTLFVEEPQRGERFAAEGAGIYLDYSKHLIIDETLRLLFALAKEVGLLEDAAERLEVQGIPMRCVSMPSGELFEALPRADRDAVLPSSVGARLAVEAGVARGWHRYVGEGGEVLSVERFGASAPPEVLLREYGFSVEEVCRRAQALLDLARAGQEGTTT